MKKLDIYQRNFIIAAVVIIVVYLIVLFFLPVTIDNTSVPTLVNGITTSMSIIMGIGGAVTGFVFRGDIEKGDYKAKELYFTVLGLLMFALVYPWGAYLWLAIKQFELAVKYSFFGYLIALLALITIYILTAKRWNLEKEDKSEETKPEKTEETEQEKLKREFQHRAVP
jgi:amino acid permease